jgi:hypothetical protein
MLRCIFVVLIASSFVAGAIAQEKPLANIARTKKEQTSSQRKITGVWKIIKLASRSTDAGWEIRPTPSVSQYIFTEKHYSYMYTPGAARRKLFLGDPNKPTDAEKVEAYDSLVAASGVYKLSGSTLTLYPLIHKNPNEMSGKPLTYIVDYDGDALRMTIVNPPFLPGREWLTVLTRAGQANIATKRRQDRRGDHARKAAR